MIMPSNPHDTNEAGRPNQKPRHRAWMDPYNLTEYRKAWFEQICEDAPHVLNSLVTDLMPKASRIFAVYESRCNGELPLCWARFVDKVITGWSPGSISTTISDDGVFQSREVPNAPERQDGREMTFLNPTPLWHYGPDASQTTEHICRTVYCTECSMGPAAQIGKQLMEEELNNQETPTWYSGQAFWTDEELAFLITRWAVQVGFLREPRPFIKNLDEILSSLDREPYSRWFDADGQAYYHERRSAWITALNAYIEELLEEDYVDYRRICVKRALPKALPAEIDHDASLFRARLRQSALMLYPPFEERVDFLCGFLIPVGVSTLARYYTDSAAREASNQWYYPPGLNAYENEKWRTLTKVFDPTAGSLGLAEVVSRHYDVSPEPWNPLSPKSQADALKRRMDAIRKNENEHMMAQEEWGRHQGLIQRKRTPSKKDLRIVTDRILGGKKDSQIGLDYGCKTDKEVHNKVTVPFGRAVSLLYGPIWKALIPNRRSEKS
jgi:hypothetical protein